MVTYAVASSVAPDPSVSNTATAATAGQATDATGSDTVAITRNVTLTVDKVFQDSSVDAGTTGHTFTIKVTNTGPSDAASVHVTDTVDARLHVTAVSDTGAGGACVASAGQSIDCTLASLANGASKTFMVTYAVASSVAPDPPISNTATAATAGQATDATATDTVTITLSSDLAITKTDYQASVVAGTPVSYTIIVTNNGPSDVTGASVADSIPSQLSGASWTCSATAGSSCGAASGSGSIATTVNLVSGGSATYTLSATVKSSATGSVANTATVSAPAGVTDTAGNNSATDTDTITLSSDLAITKTGPLSVYYLNSITYMIVVTNNGPSDVVAATVSDTLPSGLTGVTWTCSAS